MQLTYLSIHIDHFLTYFYFSKVLQFMKIDNLKISQTQSHPISFFIIQ
jgi:hypothetical protein